MVLRLVYATDFSIIYVVVIRSLGKDYLGFTVSLHCARNSGHYLCRRPPSGGLAGFDAGQTRGEKSTVYRMRLVFPNSFLPHNFMHRSPVALGSSEGEMSLRPYLVTATNSEDWSYFVAISIV